MKAIVKLPSFKRQKELITQIAKEYKIRVYWYSDINNNCGIAYHKSDPATNRESIHILKHPKVKDYLSTLFHELGHSYCYRNNVWSAYHNKRAIFRNGRSYHKTKDLKTILRTGYKAERWVDKWGRREMYKHFPHLTYRMGYTGTTQCIKWLHDNHLFWYREILERRKK